MSSTKPTLMHSLLFTICALFVFFIFGRILLYCQPSENHSLEENSLCKTSDMSLEGCSIEICFTSFYWSY